MYYGAGTAGGKSRQPATVPDLLIRRGEERDLAAIAAIQETAPEAAHWDVTGYLQYDVRVAVRREQIAGFLVWRCVGGDECEILNLAVLPEFRRQGVGRALVQWLLARFSGPVFLEVRESNAAAILLYKSLGFQLVGSRDRYYESPPETAIVMKFHSC